MSTFRDYYGKAKYRQFRPTYPDEVFKTVTDFHGPENRSLCIDLGCGSGQATVSLAKHFQNVIGFEPSQGQLDQIKEKPDNVEFRVGAAEKVDLPSGSVDMIAAASAAHWFNLELFWNEATRLLRPGGTLALWSYGFNTIDNNAATHNICKEFLALIDPYWTSSSRHIASHYKTIVPPSPPFKVTRIDSEMKGEMPVDAFLGYANTWSALREYDKAFPGKDIFPELRKKFVDSVGGEETPLQVTWPLFYILCRKEN